MCTTNLSQGVCCSVKFSWSYSKRIWAGPMPLLECSTEGEKHTNIHIRGLFSSFRNIRVDHRFDLQFVLHKYQMLQMTAGHSHPSLTYCVLHDIHVTSFENKPQQHSETQKLYMIQSCMCVRHYFPGASSTEALADPSAVTHSSFFSRVLSALPDNNNRVMSLLCCSSLPGYGGGKLGCKSTRSPSNAFSAKCDGMNRPTSSPPSH